MKRILLILLLLLVIGVPAAVLGWQYLAEPGSEQKSAPVVNAAEQIERGAYLARAGNCMACHTARGGQPYAGGRAIPTPYGAIYTSNITPDAATGIGDWSADDFWRAMHNGKSKNGDFLYPAFPFPNYTRVTRADSDAIFAYIKTVTPVQQKNREHALRFPYNQRWLLAGWRALYFRPGSYEADNSKSVEWNRGAYLVQGLGHCSACHTSRTTLGGTDIDAELGGGLIPMLNWYAPSLTSDAEAGLGNWEEKQIVDILKKGVSEKGTVFGPMAEVVAESLQYLTDADVTAMATYLKALPQTDPPAKPRTILSSADRDTVLKNGAALYEKHCAECHQANGAGYAPAYPPLAGNRSLTLHSAVNPIRIVLNGGYPPSTGGNPRPYGMPPFSHALNDEEVAAVVSYMRNAWGNQASLVSPAEVGRYRGAPLD